MKNAKEFKERMNEEEFAKLFSNAETDEDIIRIAAEQGYEITKEDIQNFEMTDEMLESVAGGKGDDYSAGGDITTTSSTTVQISPNIGL